MKCSSLFPYRPKIAPDESISSYLAILSHGYGLCISDFLEVTGVQSGIGHWHSGDVDRVSTTVSIPELASMFGQPVDQLQWSTLSSNDNLLSFHNGERGHKQSWIHGVADERLPSRGGLYQASQFCRSCLQEARPYLRITWRFSFVTVCPRHLVFLQDCCPSCSAPFSPGLDDELQESPRVYRCSACSFDFRNLRNTKRPERIDESFWTSLLRLQHLHLTLLQLSQNVGGKRLAAYLYLFGAVLDILIGDETSNLNILSLRRFLSHRLGLGSSKMWTLDKSEMRFGFLPAYERARYMLMAAAVLDPWPYQFDSLCECWEDFSQLRRSKTVDRLEWLFTADDGTNDLQSEHETGTSLAHQVLQQLLTSHGQKGQVQSELRWSSPKENLVLGAFEHQELSFQHALCRDAELASPAVLTFEARKWFKFRRDSSSEKSPILPAGIFRQKKT